MEGNTDNSVRLVSRREALQGAGVALGSLVATGSLTETVMAQSGGPSDEISGTVEDDMGAVEGATVVAVPHDTSLAALETTTAADGSYIFEQSDLHEGTNLYHVIARDGIESDPRRGVPNYPFIAAEGAPSIPDSELDHRWPANEGSDSTWTDTLGSENFDLNGPTWVTGQGARGDAFLNFDGVDDYAINTNPPAWGFDNFGFILWLRPDSVSTDQWVLFATRLGEQAANIQVDINIAEASAIRFGVQEGDGGNTFVSTTAIQADVWNFIGLSGDNGNQIEIYHALASDSSISQEDTSPYSSGLRASPGDLTLGVRWDDDADSPNSTPGYYDGDMDHHAARMGASISQSAFEDYFTATKDDYL